MLNLSKQDQQSSSNDLDRVSFDLKRTEKRSPVETRLAHFQMFFREPLKISGYVTSGEA